MLEVGGPYLAPCSGRTCHLCTPPASAERVDAHVLDLSLRDVSGWSVVEVYLDGDPLVASASFPGQSHLLQGHAPPLRFVAARRKVALRSALGHVQALVRQARDLTAETESAEAMRERHEAVRLGIAELTASGIPLS